jgi:hypothetical protein
MASAQTAVLLLTKEALESEYILDTEFPFLPRRDTAVRNDRTPALTCEPLVTIPGGDLRVGS